MSHVQMSHVTRPNESCHAYEGDVTRVWMHMCGHMNEACHTYQCVISHTWISHVTPTNESCHTNECMSHIWTSHVSHMITSWNTNDTLKSNQSHINESYHTSERRKSWIWSCRITHVDKYFHTHCTMREPSSFSKREKACFIARHSRLMRLIFSSSASNSTYVCVCVGGEVIFSSSTLNSIYVFVGG